MNSLVPITPHSDQITPSSDPVVEVLLPNPMTDLALKIIIPLHHFPPYRLRRRRFHLLRFDGSSLLQNMVNDLLRGFKKSHDLLRLESTIALMERIGQSVTPTKFLASLSHHTEALSVYSKSITNRHWSSDEDKSTLNLWNMLAYFFHCQQTLPHLCPKFRQDIFKLLEESLVKALNQNLGIFKQILECERIREHGNHINLGLYELKIRKYYELLIETPLVNQGYQEYWGLSTIANFESTKALNNMLKSQMLTVKEKLDWAQKKWLSFRLGDHHTVDRVQNLPEIKLLENEARRKTAQVNELVKKLKNSYRKSSLIPVKRTLQSLFEYEQLHVALKAISAFSSISKPGREATLQLLVVLRECLKTVMDDSKLNIPDRKSLSLTSSVIKDIRDFYEHPEDYGFLHNRTKKKDQEREKLQLENALFSDLYRLLPIIKNHIKTRLTEIDPMLTNRDPTPEQCLQAFQSRPSPSQKPSTQLAMAKEELSEKFPALTGFSERIKLKKTIPIQEKLIRLRKPNGRLINLLQNVQGKLKKSSLPRSKQKGLNAAQNKLSTLLKSLKDIFVESRKYYFISNFKDRNKKERQVHQLKTPLIEQLQHFNNLLNHFSSEKEGEMIATIESLTSLAETFLGKNNWRFIKVKGHTPSGRYSFHPLERNPLNRLLEDLKKLKAFIGSHLNRENLEKRLEQDHAFRLDAMRKINCASHLFDQYMRSLSADYVTKRPRIFRQLEWCYFALKDVRNFQTHEVWRENIQGSVNALYRLAYDLPLILSEEDREKMGPIEHKVFKLLHNAQLTSGKLKRALKEGFNPKAVDSRGCTLLHYLSSLEQTEDNLFIANILISHGASIHQPDYLTLLPLHYAAEDGNLALCQLLVQKGAVVNADSSQGTPLSLAQVHEHPNVAGFLMNKTGVQRHSNARALLDAVEGGDLNRVHYLINQGFMGWVACDGELPLHILFEKESISWGKQRAIAKALLDSQATHIDLQDLYYERSVLHIACQETDNQEVIQFLLSYQPDVNIHAKKNTPLHVALEWKHRNWVIALLKAGAQVDAIETYSNLPLLLDCSRKAKRGDVIEKLQKLKYLFSHLRMKDQNILSATQALGRWIVKDDSLIIETEVKVRVLYLLAILNQFSKRLKNRKK